MGCHLLLILLFWWSKIHFWIIVNLLFQLIRRCYLYVLLGLISYKIWWIYVFRFAPLIILFSLQTYFWFFNVGDLSWIFPRCQLRVCFLRLVQKLLGLGTFLKLNHYILSQWLPFENKVIIKEPVTLKEIVQLRHDSLEKNFTLLNKYLIFFLNWFGVNNILKSFSVVESLRYKWEYLLRISDRRI